MNEIVMTPNSMARGKYSKEDKDNKEIEESKESKAQIITEVENKVFLKIMYSVQRDNREYIISKRKSEVLSEEEIAKWKKLCEIETLECRITKEELFELITNKNDQTDEGIKKFFKSLSNCRVSFDTVTRDGVDAVLDAPLMAHYYKEKNGSVYRIVVAAKLYKFLFDLGLGYTENALEVLYKLKGTYAQRMYLIFRSWTGIKHDIVIGVQELREMLGVGKLYPTFNSFETLIKRTLKAIHKSGFMDATIKEKIKKGRNIDSLRFNVIDHEPRNYVKIDEVKEEEEEQYVIWLDYIKVANQELLERLERKYSDQNFNSPLVKKIFYTAYDKTLNRDNKFTMIQDKNGGTNFALFNYIVAGEFLTNQLQVENQFKEADEYR